MEASVPYDPMKRFVDPGRTIGALDADAATAVVAAAADVALVIDETGVIRDLVFADDELASGDCRAWLGQNFLDVVTQESRAKVEALMEDARQRQRPRWRHVNHPVGEGDDLPINYSAVAVPSTRSILALGRDLRVLARMQQRLVEAQIDMEREYARLRSAEARYRLLFQITREPVLIAEAASGRIVDANPSATEALKEAGPRLVDRKLADLVEGEDAERLAETLSTVRVSGAPAEVEIAVRGGRRFTVRLSLFREGRTAHVLVRLEEIGGEPRATEEGRARFYRVIEQLPDAFAVTDAARQVVAANVAFLELVQLPSLGQVLGKPIDSWLGRLGFDVASMVESLERHGALRQLETVVNGALGSSEDVEVSAVRTDAVEGTYYGFAIRPMRVRPTETGPASARSVEHLAGLVGKVPLKDLIRETTDMIERMCIEAALKLTGDNRASAAEMLGLSRQSLYVKLRRYGLIETDGEDTN